VRECRTALDRGGPAATIRRASAPDEPEHLHEHAAAAALPRQPAGLRHHPGDRAARGDHPHGPSAVALFRRWIDGAGLAWRTLAANSFGIYYVHPLVLYPLAYVLVGVAIPAVAKLAILVVATLVGSLAVSALVLKRVPGLRRMF
jgi:hypothetical protein